jgi:hypothetical protein
VFLQIKHLYTAIEDYRNQSGFPSHWDNDHGAGIEGDAAAEVWTTYTQQKVVTLCLILDCLLVANKLYCCVVQYRPTSIPKPWVGTS